MGGMIPLGFITVIFSSAAEAAPDENAATITTVLTNHRLIIFMRHSRYWSKE
jgi:hypothetical protein